MPPSRTPAAPSRVRPAQPASCSAASSLPAEAVGEDAAEQDAGCAGRTRDGAPGAQRLVALGTVLKEAGDDREGGRRDDRGAQTLCRAGRDQLALVRGEP